MSKPDFRASGHDAKDLAWFGLGDRGPVKWGRVGPLEDWSSFFSGDAEVAVEERGPVRATLRIRPTAPPREGGLGYEARLYVYARATFARVELTLFNYDDEDILNENATDAGAVIINDKHVAEFRIQLPTTASTVSLGLQHGGQTLSATGSPRLDQFDVRGYRVRSSLGDDGVGEHAPGWISAADGRGSSAIATKWFWETFPKSVGYNASARTLDLDLWPHESEATYTLGPARAKTYEFAIGFDADPEELSAFERNELRPFPDPELVASLDLTHGLVSLRDAAFPSYGEYVRRSVSRLEANQLFGDIDFGDQQGWVPDQRWNGYHGVAHELFMFYLSSGDPSYFRLAEAFDWHEMDVDTFHWGILRGARECEYCRAADHARPFMTGSIKEWNFGDIDYYLLTGRQRVVGNLDNALDYLTTVGGARPPNLAADRATALPLLHLAYLYDAIGSGAVLNELGAVRGQPWHFDDAGRTDVVGASTAQSWTESMSTIAHFLSQEDTRRRYPSTPFMISWEVDALYHFARLTADGESAHAALSIADDMFHRLVLPTGMPIYGWATDSQLASEPYLRLQPFPDAVDVVGARAYQLTHDSRYLDDIAPPLDWRLHYERAAYWSFGLGSTIPEALHALKQAGRNDDDLARGRGDVNVATVVPELERLVERSGPLGDDNRSRAYVLLAEEVARALIGIGRYDEALSWSTPFGQTKAGYDVDLFLSRGRQLKQAAEARRQ